MIIVKMRENRKSEIKVVCAWCGKATGEVNGKGVEGISHGLCPECLAKLKIKDAEEEARDNPLASEPPSPASPP